MALHTVTYGRGMNGPFQVSGILIRVAGQTESLRSCRNQLYPSDVFDGSNLMATGAAHRNRRMDRLAFGFILVAGEAGGGIRLRIKCDGMLRSG